MKRYLHLSKRDKHGVLLLDKPSGWSSSFVLNRIKRLFFVRKAGYAGTLDPLATGMLPICFGKETKFAEYLSNSDKRYKVLAKLGVSTNTFDADGIVVRVSSINYSNNHLQECLQSFVGTMHQIPPMFSSVKYCGLPLYKYARLGISIPRKSRLIHVYRLRSISTGIDTIELDIHCSKGTYIRSIINDIGEKLGCGAHVISLRRVMVGQYVNSSMVKIETIENIFYDKALSDLEVLEKLDKLLINSK